MTMEADKKAFYEKAAKGLAASTVFYNVDAVVHVEDKSDIWFWQQMLSRYSRKRYKFLPATKNERGHKNTGCTQCLKYKDFLSRRFFICIDSDLRFLLGEDGISADRGIMQTYTYSWENHCTFAEKLQESFDELTRRGCDFDFVHFLHSYSEAVYKPFLLMLHYERNSLPGFNRDKFNSLTALQYRKGDELGNGRQLIERLQENLTGIPSCADTDISAEKSLCETLKVNGENVYLYVRGHNIYNLLTSIGKKLCEGTGADFEENILKSALAFRQYDAICRIKEDLNKLDSLRDNC